MLLPDKEPEFFTRTQLLSWKFPDRSLDVIEHGVLIPQGTFMIVGDAKAWKSFLAVYTAYCISTGTPWFGYKTNKASVFLNQYEIVPPRFQDRIIKFDSHWGHSNPYPSDSSMLTRSDISPLPLTSDQGFVELNTRIAKAKKLLSEDHTVVILDPTYVLVQGNIADNAVCSKFLSHIAEIKKHNKVSVILIHHPRQTVVDDKGNPVDLGASEAMGSSYWSNNVDTMMRIKLTNPANPGSPVHCGFVLARHADTELYGFELKWSRRTCMPVVTKVDPIYSDPADLPEEPSIRELS